MVSYEDAGVGVGIPTEKRKPKCDRASSQPGIGGRGCDVLRFHSSTRFGGTEVSLTRRADRV